jgi:hypothetical protein
LQSQKNSSFIDAEVAHLVEHDLAKVGVAGSSPVFRSRLKGVTRHTFFVQISSVETYCYPGGGTGRHAGLKILFAAMRVWVQLPSWVQLLKAAFAAFFISSVIAIINSPRFHL